MVPVSLIITCYNEGYLIYNAYTSVSPQLPEGSEVLLINDCSQDIITNEICKKLDEQGFVKYFRNPGNYGLSYSRNEGFRKAKNEIVIFLDADDALPDGSIELISKYAALYPEADFFYGDYLIIERESSKIQTVSGSMISENGRISTKKLASEWLLLGTSPCKKSLWEKVGGYDLTFSNSCQDVDFWQRCLLAGAKGIYVPETIYHWFKSSSGMNNNFDRKDFLKMLFKNSEFYFKFSNKTDFYEKIYIQVRGNKAYGLLFSELLKRPQHISGFFLFLIHLTIGKYRKQRISKS